MTDLQKAYQEWVDTSPVESTPDYRRGLNSYIRQYYVTRSESPQLSHAEVEVYLRDNGFSEVMREQMKTCCVYEHVRREVKDGIPRLVPLADELVCPRERAWRRYCRIRDGLAPDERSVN